MSWSRWTAFGWLTLSVLMTSCTLSAGAVREVSTVITEEEPSGSHVLDLSASHLITELAVDVRYQLLGSSDYFLIDEFSGEIITKTRLDRETVCTPAVDVCVISIDVMISYEQQFSIIKVKVELSDLDDNIPVFTQSSITLNVSEGDNLNMTLSLPRALDSDTEHNVDTVYHLIKPDNVPSTADILLLWSVSDLYMIISGDLDHEMISSLSFTVQSFTPTQSNRRSNLSVILNILDVNDNAPVFSQSVYRIKVSESMAINTVIGQVSAVDSDTSNVHSKVLYKLAHGEENFPITINATNGELTLGDRLDYETTTDYILTVVAYNEENAPADHMTSHMTSTAVVYVTVTDKNDYSPQITITTLEDDHIATIAEHSIVGTFIAHITVRDGDSTSPNNDVICHLHSDKYSLNPLYDTEYTITVNSDLDRESTRSTEYDVKVSCSDGGNPPLLSQVTIPVVLVDINDHSPEFSKSVHHVYHLTENSPLYTPVIRLTATDKDEADNSMIKYTITDADLLPFTIDENTGGITVSDILDHEVKSEYSFSVTAQDQGSPPLSTSTSVHVHLVDLNDNRPLFGQSEYSFEISEELSASTAINVGEVRAVDSDQKGGAKVWYKLMGEEEEGGNYFSIDYSTGVIYTTAQLDRERQDQYQLTVLATDFGVPELTSSVRVKIRVTDINDNSPVFRAEETIQTYTISYQSKAGVTVTVVTATDADSSDRSLLTYNLMTDRDETADIFTVDAFTGRLYTSRSLTDQSIGFHSMTIIATDTAQHTASLDITVLISEETTQAPSFAEEIIASRREVHVNLTIISALSAVVLIVVVLALTAFIKLRNQKSKGSRLYNCRRAAESRFSNSITSSQTSDYPQHHNDLFSNLTDSSHLHHSIISDRSQVHSMCDGSGCDNHIIPAYIKEGTHLARAYSMRAVDSGCESLASPLSITLLKQGNRASTFTSSPEYQPAPAIKHLVSYDMQRPPTVQTPASYVNTRYESTCAVKDMTVTIPYADDSIVSAKDIHDDSTSSCDVFTTDDLSSYDGDNELHSGNCAVCLDNSIVSWNHTHNNIDTLP